MLNTPAITPKSILLCVAVVSFPAFASAQSIKINGPVAAGSVVNATGTKGATVYAYTQPKAKVTVGAKCDVTAAKFATHEFFALASSAAQDLTLTTPIAEGDQVCLASTDAEHPDTAYSTLETVVAPVKQPTSVKLSFAGKLDGGVKTINIQGNKDAKVKVYQFDGGYKPQDKAEKLSAADIPFGELLPAQNSGSDQTTVTATSLSADGTQTIVLANPIVAGTQLLLVEETKGPPADTQYSSLQPVTDPNDYGKVRTFYTVGALISNQTNSGNSTSAAQYIDIGISFDWLTEERKKEPVPIGSHSRFGANSYIAARFSTVPVTAAVKSNSTTTASSLNILSSQESVRVRGGIFFPIILTKWTGGNAFIVAPIAKGGFNTLLNPSANTATTTAGTASLPATFSPTYDDFSFGTRAAWRRYSVSGPGEVNASTWMQMDVTMGRYNNLESLECGTTVILEATKTLPTNTSCFNTNPGKPNANPVVPPTYDVYGTNRVAIPRLAIEGFARFPGTPFVIGIDANLAQYGVFLPKQKLDMMNRAGSDVRIYFGITGNLTDLFRGLKLGAASSK